MKPKIALVCAGVILSSLFGVPAVGAPATTQGHRSQWFELDSTKGLTAKDVKISVGRHEGRKAVRAVSPDRQGPNVNELVMIDGTDFRDGTIEFDMAAKGVPPAPGMRAPGFVGLAFRSTADASSYELMYARPGNSNSPDQLVRNHSVQYSGEHGFKWPVSRKSWPGVYEAWAPLKPDAWTKVRIEVSGRSSKMYLNGATRPSLVIDDLRTGRLRGALGLYVGPMTEAYFSHLRVTLRRPAKVTTGTEPAGTWDTKFDTDFGPQEAAITLRRTDEKVTGTYSGTLGQNLELTGTWVNGFVELNVPVTVPDTGQKSTLTMAGWLDGDTGKGRAKVQGDAEGTWAGVRRR